jgi:hypothetical protein
MERLHVCKKSLRQEQEVFDAGAIDDREAVEQAASWANALVAKVHRGPGDNVETAMYRAEAKWALPFSLLWALRYRKPKAMAVGAWSYLKHVYEAECGRQEARLRHELEITKRLPATPARQALIAEAEALLGEQESGE